MIHKVTVAPIAHSTSTHTAGSIPATTGTIVLLAAEALLLNTGITIPLVERLILRTS